MSAQVHTTIVTVDYNCNDDTERLLESLAHQRTSSSYRVVVVNNDASNPTSKERLDRLTRIYDNVDVLHNPINAGYFGGFNYGLQAALNNSPQWVVFCNADIVFSDPDFLEKLRHLQVDGDVWCLAPRILTQNGRDQNPFLAKPPSKWRWRMYDIYFSSFIAYRMMYLINDLIKLLLGGRGRKPNSLSNTPTSIYAPHGACFILRPQYFDVYSSFDDHLFLWGEEIILAETVRRAGKCILYIPALQVYHNESGPIQRVIDDRSLRRFRTGQEVNRYLQDRYVEP